MISTEYDSSSECVMHPKEQWSLYPERELVARMYSEHPAAQEWLAKCRAVLHNHGSNLVEALGRSGWTDNIRAADDLLVYWFRQGILLPAETASPSLSQKFFGHGGMWWDSMRSKPLLHPPCFFGWMPAPGQEKPGKVPTETRRRTPVKKKKTKKSRYDAQGMVVKFSKNLDNSEAHLAALGPSKWSLEKHALQAASLLTSRSGLPWLAHIGQAQTEEEGHLYIYPPETELDEDGLMPEVYWEVLERFFGCVSPVTGSRRWVILSDEIPFALSILRRRRPCKNPL